MAEFQVGWSCWIGRAASIGLKVDFHFDLLFRAEKAGIQDFHVRYVNRWLDDLEGEVLNRIFQR